MEGFQYKDEEYIFISAIQAEQPKCILKEILAKVWQISENVLRITLESTSQLNHQDPDSSLSHKFGINDCMFRYKIINTYLLSDTFCVTNIEKKISAFTCMQLFVSDKGFVRVYEMRSDK